MMELPESYGLAGQITRELTGKVISEIVILQTPHKFCFFKGNVEDYADMLEGQMITGATFQGGMLEIDTEDVMIVVGNGVLQDILWSAGIDPRFPLENATEEDFKALYDSTVSVVQRMCEAGGRDTENDIYGNPGKYTTQLSKKSYGEPCTRCGTLIGRAAYMGGTVYFCEHCQKRS